jgi:hypothetical protein
VDPCALFAEVVVLDGGRLGLLQRVSLRRLGVTGHAIDLDVVVFVLGECATLLVERITLGDLAFHARRTTRFLTLSQTAVLGGQATRAGSPLANTSPSGDASTTIVSPSANSPCSSLSAIGSATSRWSTRFSGRAP